MISIDPTKGAVINKARTKADIEAVRDQKLGAGVSFNGVLFQTDAAFQGHLTGIVGAINAGLIPGNASVAIRTKVNTIEQLSTLQVKQLAGAVLQYVQSVFAESWAAKDAL